MTEAYDEEVEAKSREGLLTYIAVAVLTLPDGTRIPVFDALEHGDGEGLRAVSAYIRNTRKLGLLKGGETLDRVLVEVVVDLSKREGVHLIHIADQVVDLVQCVPKTTLVEVGVET